MTAQGLGRCALQLDVAGQRRYNDVDVGPWRMVVASSNDVTSALFLDFVLDSAVVSLAISLVNPLVMSGTLNRIL